MLLKHLRFTVSFFRFYFFSLVFFLNFFFFTVPRIYDDKQECLWSTFYIFIYINKILKLIDFLLVYKKPLSPDARDFELDVFLNQYPTSCKFFK